MKIAILGTGAYSLAIAHALSKKNENSISMWTHDVKLFEEFNNTNSLSSIIDFKIKSNVKVDVSLENVLEGASLIYIVVASKFFRVTVEQLRNCYNKNTPICIATKGIDDANGDFLSDVASEILETTLVSVLSGPTFAIDIINDEPIALSLGSKSEETTDLVLSTISNSKLKIMPISDVVGVQLCNTYKNIIAIASGMINGIGYTNSATAFLLTESLKEMKQIITLLGGNEETVLSFAGVGDLILTCTSPKSRNFTFGYYIGKYNDQKRTDEYLNTTTVEGFNALISLKNLLDKRNIEAPLLDNVLNVVLHGVDPEKFIEFLINKDNYIKKRI